MLKIILSGLLLAVSPVVLSVPVGYTFKGTYDFSYVVDYGDYQRERSGSYYGDFGPEYTATIVFDNGESNVKDVVWTYDDFLYVQYSNGDYTARYDSAIYNDFRDFVADSNGVIVDGFLEVSDINIGSLWLDVNWGEVNASGSVAAGVTGYGASAGGPDMPLRSERGLLVTVPEPSHLLGLYTVAFGLMLVLRANLFTLLTLHSTRTRKRSVIDASLISASLAPSATKT